MSWRTPRPQVFLWLAPQASCLRWRIRTQPNLTEDPHTFSWFLFSYMRFTTTRERAVSPWAIVIVVERRKNFFFPQEELLLPFCGWPQAILKVHVVCLKQYHYRLLLRVSLCWKKNILLIEYQNPLLYIFMKKIQSLKQHFFLLGFCPKGAENFFPRRQRTYFSFLLSFPKGALETWRRDLCGRITLLRWGAISLFSLLSVGEGLKSPAIKALSKGARRLSNNEGRERRERKRAAVIGKM